MPRHVVKYHQQQQYVFLGTIDEWVDFDGLLANNDGLSIKIH
jgi:hypothetical protein